MCGITGFLRPQHPHDPTIIRRMADAITHRGPDYGAIWCDDETGIALGHRRLSILDLSDAGHQPMPSHDGRYVIVFNGEIYNHRKLRARLEAEGYPAQWRGQSDTEVLLAAITYWGFETTLKRANGMFAIALWDRQTRTLSFARDRLGEKPLYYGLAEGTLVFGSEIKALAQHPDWVGELDRDVISLFLRFNYVPGPYSIFKDIFKLPPGHWVSFSAEDLGKFPTPVPYWNLSDIDLETRGNIPEAELLDQLQSQLLASVGSRMEADVDLGAFLSGGIDSSLIVALMQAQSISPVRTFTIGFDVPGYNEAIVAKQIAEHLGTFHTELYVTPGDALNIIPDLPSIWDEPFADSSQMPTLILSRLTRKDVTVALSGDGGDEFFCGYNRYASGYDLYEKLSVLPIQMRVTLKALLSSLPVHALDRMMARLLGEKAFPAVGDRVQKLGRVLSAPDISMFYNTLVSQHYLNNNLVLGSKSLPVIHDYPEFWPDVKSPRELMMYLDAITYLPGDILTKVDRASMACSLEARAPFLDPDLISFARSLPMSMKYRDGKTKWALREILARYIPRPLFERPKMGFGIPIEHWLAGPLRDWAEDLLSEDKIKRQGILNPKPIRKMWAEQCSGKGRWHHQLWTILMFQSWLETEVVSRKK